MYWNVLIQICLGVVVAVTSSFFTAHLAMRKFYTEKWWDRKEKAYKEIINALYDMLEFYEVFKDDYGQDDFISEEHSKELHQKHHEGSKTVHRATDLAVLYVSDDAVRILENLKVREILDYDSNPLWDVYDLEYQNYKVALEQFIKIATSELKGN